jgi:adenylosuccinate lyase
VHWGATTQNITQSGDILLVRHAHDAFLTEIANVLDAMADLADRSATVLMAGRTHGQHAVPMTFGFKVAAWLDELLRHVTRLRQAEPRLFVAMMGGAIGTFASFGDLGREVQANLAKRLGLLPAAVPGRNTLDHFAEYVCLLAMLAATCGRIGHEVATLMKPEFGEVAEPSPASAVGSSTMPHKRNPQLSYDLVAGSASIRALVPLALEALHGEHEADSATEAMMFEAVSRACVLTGDLLPRVRLIVAGLELDEPRMRANTDLSAGALMSEAVMLGLGVHVGRQHAHTIVAEAARTAAATGVRFGAAVAADARVTAHLDATAIELLVDPNRYTGLSAEIARSTAARARAAAVTVRATDRLRQDEPAGSVA